MAQSKDKHQAGQEGFGLFENFFFLSSISFIRQLPIAMFNHYVD